MAVSSCSLSWISPCLSHKLNLPHTNCLPRNTATSSSNTVFCALETNPRGEIFCQRRPLLLGVGALTANLQPINLVFAQEKPDRYRAFVDYEDGYSYVYPIDWKVRNKNHINLTEILVTTIKFPRCLNVSPPRNLTSGLMILHSKTDIYSYRM